MLCLYPPGFCHALGRSGRFFPVARDAKYFCVLKDRLPAIEVFLYVVYFKTALCQRTALLAEHLIVYCRPLYRRDLY